jgi:hypothetical protein
MSAARRNIGVMSDAERNAMADRAERLAKQISDRDVSERLLRFAAEQRAGPSPRQLDGAPVAPVNGEAIRLASEESEVTSGP